MKENNDTFDNSSVIVNMDTLMHPSFVNVAPIESLFITTSSSWTFTPSKQNDIGYQLKDYQNANVIPKETQTNKQINVRIRVGWSAWTCCSQCCCRGGEKKCGNKAIAVDTESKWYS